MSRYVLASSIVLSTLFVCFTLFTVTNKTAANAAAAIRTLPNLIVWSEQNKSPIVIPFLRHCPPGWTDVPALSSSVMVGKNVAGRLPQRDTFEKYGLDGGVGGTDLIPPRVKFGSKWVSGGGLQNSDHGRGVSPTEHTNAVDNYPPYFTVSFCTPQ